MRQSAPLGLAASLNRARAPEDADNRQRSSASKICRERTDVEVRIGVTHATRELTIDMNESADVVRDQVTKAIESKEAVLTLVDDRGRIVCIPAEKLAYVEISGEAGRRMGFAR
jgi:hypothetical protein